jgi:YebC/PmpR family DNA-binding regulatory protein
MSGHSKWASIKHKKGATDAKRGKIFTRIIKEITVAARMGGGDPDGNPRLRTAIQAAKQANMPLENITRGIKKGTGELEGVHYEEHTYEGYGSGGAAIFIEAMTDNKNRTIGEIRTIFGKNGGNVGENGCVGWMFEQKGLITVPVEGQSEVALMELIMEAGGDDLKIEGDMYEVISSLENFETVRKALEEANVKIETAELTRIPQNTVSLDESQAKQILRLMDLLDDHDDIQKAYSNFEISDEIMAAIIEES